MNKKLLGILLILVAVVATGSVFAAQSIDVDGYKFNLPSNFEEVPSLACVNEKMENDGVTYTANSKAFQDKTDNDEAISILVAKYDGLDVDDEILSQIGTPKTIKGINGYFSENETMAMFTYAKDGKAIIMTASDDDLFEDFLI